MRIRAPKVRTGQTPTRLSKSEFLTRWRENFYDPAFSRREEQLKHLGEVAWDAYKNSRKSPREKEAGDAFTHPKFKLSVEWLATRAYLQAAQKEHENPTSPSRVLLICASPRNDHTCPTEMSKTFRLVEEARKVMQLQPKVEVDLLDLSRLTSEYGRVIYPCKACVSTAMPLCHWPCSCYPNYYLGQTQDRMNELYPRWVAAHGVMIITPVHWYQVPSTFKLMMDRLVCADGGNPDPTSTHGKTPDEAKKLELKGWDYPKHLRGRAFSLVVHGDSDGAGKVRAALHDWLTDMELIPVEKAIMDRYIGYYKPYATSHEDLDDDKAIQIEVHNAALELVKKVKEVRFGTKEPELPTKEPRPK